MQKYLHCLIIDYYKKTLLRLKRSDVMFHMKHYRHIKIKFALFATYILVKKSQKNLQPNKINTLLLKSFSDF